VQWDLWTGSVDPLRSVDPSNFYDLQARSMLPGHLDVPKGSLGIDAFVHAGHAYTYFGIFPSLLRMPILVLTTRFDGRLMALGRTVHVAAVLAGPGDHGAVR